MLTWKERSREEANLFNPAFCAALLICCVEDFSKKTGLPLSFPLAFLTLPIVLHSPTRKDLPTSTSTPMNSWLTEHREHLAGFPDRVRRVKPTTQEALMFALTHKGLNLFHGELVLGPNRLSKLDGLQMTEEVVRCFNRSRFLGRWMAEAGSPTTILAGWGMRP